MLLTRLHRAPRQTGVLFQREHLARQIRQHRRRITGGAADIEHAIVFADLGGLDQLGQDHGFEQTAVAVFADRHITVEIGETRHRGRHEPFARNILKRRNQAQVGDVRGADLTVNHHAPGGGKLGHRYP